MKQRLDCIHWALFALILQANFVVSFAQEITSAQESEKQDDDFEEVEEESEFLGEEGDEKDFTVIWIVTAIPIVLILYFIIHGGNTLPPVDMTGRLVKREILPFGETFGTSGWRRIKEVFHWGTPSSEDYEPIPDTLPKPGTQISV